jgi:predicted O-methyltransferase YrrM
LEGVVESVVASGASRIVDLGAAEGYYAVGLALRLPQAEVIAFEMEPAGQQALAEMIQLNEVSKQVSIRGKAEPEDLRLLLEDPRDTVIICEVEGYESVLLNPETVPQLSQCSILVELHDFLIPGLTETLKTRFAATHHIEHILQEPRFRTDFPWRTLGTTLLPKRYLDWAVSEWRPVRMAWLWMTPNVIRGG